MVAVMKMDFTSHESFSNNIIFAFRQMHFYLKLIIPQTSCNLADRTFKIVNVSYSYFHVSRFSFPIRIRFVKLLLASLKHSLYRFNF